MRLIAIIIILLINNSLIAQDEVYNCPKGQKKEFVEGASLDKYHSVDTGRNIVFQYVQYFDCPDWYDEQIDIHFFWCIPGNSSSFNLNLNYKDSLNSPVDYYIN